MAVENIGKNAPDGSRLGWTSTEKVGFWGATPVVQPTVTPVATATATTTLNETRLGRLETALVAAGIINLDG